MAVGGKVKDPVDELHRNVSELNVSVYQIKDALWLGRVWIAGLSVVVVAAFTTLWLSGRAAHNCIDKGHEYTARYDTAPATKEIIEVIGNMPTFKGYPSTTCDAIKNAETKNYSCDVCTYCGNVINLKSVAK